jgi:hypothetical protein
MHFPDLTKLEADVREQLASLQNSLSATVKNPKSSDATLAEAYGTMGEIYQAYALLGPRSGMLSERQPSVAERLSLGISVGKVGSAGRSCR